MGQRELKREVHGQRRLLELVLSGMKRFWVGRRVALLKGGTGKVTDEECKGNGRVILFLTSLWILEFLRNQRETKNHQLQNVPPFSGGCDSDCPLLSGED